MTMSDLKIGVEVFLSWKELCCLCENKCVSNLPPSHLFSPESREVFTFTNFNFDFRDLQIVKNQPIWTKNLFFRNPDKKLQQNIFSPPIFFFFTKFTIPNLDSQDLGLTDELE